MPKTSPKPEAEGNLDRAAFDATLKARGIARSREEAESVFALATWLSDGVAGLGDAFPAADRPSAEVADLSMIDAGKRLRTGQLTSLALVQAALARNSPAATTVDRCTAFPSAART